MDSDTGEPSVEELEERVSTLEDELSVTDQSGGEHTLSSLREFGLTRRQALHALGLLAAGYGMSAAVTEALSSNVDTAEAAASGSIGTQSNPVDVVAESVSTDDITTTKAYKNDLSVNNPHTNRTAERSGAPAYQIDPNVDNPIYTASDLNNDEGSFSDATDVFDPFWRWHDGTIYVFFEYDRPTDPKGLAYLSGPGIGGLTYGGLILDDGTGRSYPWFQRIDGQWYMVPENAGTRDFEIYTTSDSNFPTGWGLSETAISANVIDATPVYWDSRWYVRFYDSPNSEHKLYYADKGRSLTGRTWTEHPSSPIHTPSSDGVEGPAGRDIVRPNGIYQFYQDDGARRVECYFVDELTTNTFNDSLTATSPVISKTESGWTGSDVHHLDSIMKSPEGRDVVIIDGEDQSSEYAIGVATTARQSYTEWLAYVGSDTTVSSNGEVGNVTDTKETRFIEATSGTRYIVPSNGWYQAEGRLTWSPPSATGYTLVAELRRFDGSTNNNIDTDTAEVNQSRSAGEPPTNYVSSGIRYWESGDEILLDAVNNDGSNSHDVQGGFDKSWLSVRRVK